MAAPTSTVPARSPIGRRSRDTRRRWWHRGPFAHREVRISVGVVVLFLFLFYGALPLLASHRSEVSFLGHIHPGYLVLGVVLEIGALVAYTQLTHTVLPRPGPRRLRLFRINLSTLALSHVSPGGTAPGAALGYRLLTQSGVSGTDTGFALGTQGIGSAVVLNALFWLALVAFLVVHGFHAPINRAGEASTTASALVITAAAIGVVLFALVGAFFAVLSRRRRPANELVRGVAVRLHLRHPDRVASVVGGLTDRFALLVADRRLLARAVGWATANWMLDAASLWVFVAAFSHFISPVDLLVAYGLANILAAIPITPGGLGVVEFVLITMITGFGPTTGEALSSVLAYRAVNFWLPIPIGGIAYASLELERGPLYRRLRSWGRSRVDGYRPGVPASPPAPGEPEPRNQPVDGADAATVTGPGDGLARARTATNGTAAPPAPLPGRTEEPSGGEGCPRPSATWDPARPRPAAGPAPAGGAGG